MMMQTTSRPQFQTHIGAWLNSARRMARRMGYLAPVAEPMALTRRQSLLMAQDRKKAEEQACRLKLIRSIKGQP